MVYRFILVSDEVDNFRRDITIDSDATFLALHAAILEAVKYDESQITSFFICNDDWEKLGEITLIDMDSDASEDSYVMESTLLSELLDEKGQKLLYVFEPLTDRCFFMELKEIIPGKSQDKPQVTKSEGKPPAQNSGAETLDLAKIAASPSAAHDLLADDLDLDDEEGYNEDELADFNEDNLF
ncbi:IS1096 element passenger TnpR family protein [Candidatus Symbiothrix dinenymphae]|uniref:IS1096 element passenger TnpR family protein n=1 Tax=Candidatus Symbiothrix dinenymphae TaxID=467085 RepID=UPI0006C3B6AE|nr:hypothetical protein [Candidatus Symbiothrix dinenymphae]GAP73446.1 hypothetical protein SAMD00024442_9_56 [Candidatus Symbiothrix dinenymphae]